MTKRYSISNGYRMGFGVSDVDPCYQCKMVESETGSFVHYDDYIILIKALNQIASETINGEQTLGASVAKGILERVK